MAKSNRDLILRDRLEFNVDFAGGGNVTTQYGRVDLSEFVSMINREGLKIKEVLFQPRLGDASWGNTGAFNPTLGSPSSANESALKIWATTTAYERAQDVGIASPGVVCVEDWTSVAQLGTGASVSLNRHVEHNKYGPLDLHPDGYVTVTDLLIGVAADKLAYADEGSATMHIDLMIIAEPVKVTQADLTEMLVQGQDQ